MAILEGLLAVVSGGATGLIGSAINDVSDYFKEKRKYEHDLASKELDIKFLNAETDASLKIAETEKERAQMEADAQIEFREMDAFMETQKSDAEVLEAVANAKKSSILLNIAAFTRTMVRPLLTLYLCVISTVMYLDSYEFLEDTKASVVQSSSQEVTAITEKVYVDITNNVLYLTSASVLFWFGQRKQKR